MRLSTLNVKFNIYCKLTHVHKEETLEKTLFLTGRLIVTQFKFDQAPGLSHTNPPDNADLLT